MRRRGRPLKWGAVLAACAAALAAACAAALYLGLPDVGVLAAENPKTTAYIQLYIRRTMAKGKRPVVMMRWTPLYEISPYLRSAVLIGEDDTFYKHGGVDWDALEKALEYDRKKGRFARGASTITQQVARNLYLSPERSALRKLKEILIAKKLERALTKDRILELYLNIAEWGRGIYGAQAASQIYFGKNAGDLDPGEAAALAAALPSPWRRNPAKAAEEPVLERAKESILARMRKAGYLPPGVPEAEIEAPDAIGSAAGSAPRPDGKGKKDDPPPPAPCGAPAPPGSVKVEPPDSCGPGSSARVSGF